MGNLFESMDLDRDTTPKGRFLQSTIPALRPQRPPSFALVAVIAGRGRIVDWAASDVSMDSQIESCGKDTEELECVDPPEEDGVYVFEGIMRGSGPDRDGEYDVWWVGSYRALTEEERQEWKTHGHLEDLWGDLHWEYEESLICYHCKKPKREHTPRDNDWIYRECPKDE